MHLINHLRLCNGNVHAAVDLACAQVASGDQVCFAAGQGDLTPLLARQGIDFFEVTFDKNKPIQSLRELRRLWSIIRQFKPDVLHAHMMASALIGKVAAKAFGVPLVTTVHNAFDSHSILMRVGDRVIAVSTQVGRDLATRGIPKRKIAVILNATLNAPRRDFFGLTPVSWHSPAIATVCGLHDRKGVRDLLAAFDIVSQQNIDAHLYIVGEGPSRSDYEAIASGLPASTRIHFMGEMRDTKSPLAATDIFVLASHADPCPLVISEAREAGCAIVASNVDGIPEMLDWGDAGILVPARAPDQFANAILGLLAEPRRLQDMRAASAAYDRGFWSTKRVANETRGVYTELIGARP
jgi:glycosyltransferase involved in cell wall biosynthesis